VNAGAALGLVIMAGSEAATLARVEPFYTWNTPICWTGFILFADSVVWRARGNSWMRSAPREFAFLVVMSIPLWLVFEGYNLFIENWYYVGLPEHPVLRLFGYAWAFATISPAIFEGAELIGVWRNRFLPANRQLSLTGAEAPPPARADADASPRISFSSARHGRGRSVPVWPIALGAVLLLWPIVWPSPYLAAPVWLGFIFLLDPLNARAGRESLFADWRQGRTDRLKNLGLSGLLCGILWEFWNYWSSAKWHYTVPIMENLKIFEMPVPGYLGFPPFAFECFAMYVYVRAFAGQRFTRPIGL
jgi:hypothetical protein